MANQKTEKNLATTTVRNDNEPRFVALALDAAQRGQSTAVAVLQDARAEVRAAVEGTIDLAEKLSAGAVRFARKLVQKVDDAASDALKGTERVLSEAIEDARETARKGRELADKAIEKVTGQSSAA